MRISTLLSSWPAQLHLWGWVMVAFSLTPNVQAQALHNEQGDASNVFAEAQHAVGFPIAGSLAQRDADLYQVCFPTTVPQILRYYAETPGTSSSGRPLDAQTYLGWGPSLTETSWAWKGLDDLRSNFVGFIQMESCVQIGLSVSSSPATGYPVIVDDPLRVDASMSVRPEIPNYTLELLAARKLRADRVRTQPQVEFLDIRNQQISVYDLSQTEAVVFTYDNPTGAFDPGEVKVSMFRAGPGTSGQRIRVYGNVRGDCAVLNPDGSIASMGADNIRHLDFVNTPGVYPAPAPFQDGIERGALCDYAVQEGQTVVVGNFIGPNGTVRGPGDCEFCVRDAESSLPVRRAQVIALVYSPSVTFASTPVQVVRDAATGYGLILVTCDGSRQTSAYRVTLPDQGFMADLQFVTDANASATWSQAGAFVDTLWVPPGVLPEGGPVRVVVTPLGADAHWDFAELTDQAINVTVGITVGDEDVPQASSLDLSVFPNPATTSLTATLQLGRSSFVTVVVLDMMGREVARLHEGALSAGQQSLPLDTRGLASGVYLLRVSGEDGLVAAQRFSIVR